MNNIQHHKLKEQGLNRKTRQSFSIYLNSINFVTYFIKINYE